MAQKFQKVKNFKNSKISKNRKIVKMSKFLIFMKIKNKISATYYHESVLRLSFFFSFLYISLCLKKVPQMGGSRAVLKMCNLPSGLKL